MRSRILIVALCQVVAVAGLGAQTAPKQRFTSLTEAQQAGGVLAGRAGPRRIVWLDGGNRFSFIGTNAQTRRPELRTYDPASGRDTLLFTSDGLTLPGSTQPFDYQSFQFSRDFKNLVFQTNFQPIYRNSGDGGLLRLLARRPVAAPRRQGRAHGRALARRRAAR